MKTFKQYLITETAEDYKQGQLQYWAEQIVRDCKPAIDAAGGVIEYHVYRGIKSSEPFMKKDVRKNRRPLDTPEFVHDIMDQWFYDNYGIRFRSNSMFVWGRPTKVDAKHYGNTYMVFPIGQFNFIWSQRIQDIGVDIVDHYIEAQHELESEGRTTDQWTLKRILEDFLDKADFSNQNFDQAVKKGNEILINTDKYYALSLEHFAEKYVHRALADAYQKVHGVSP